MPTIDITKPKKEVFNTVKDNNFDYQIAEILAEKIRESCQNHETLNNIEFYIDVLRSHIYDMLKNEKK